MFLLEFDTPPSSSAPVAAPYHTPPALIAFTLGVMVVCFVGFSLVYLCKYCFSGVIHTWAFRRTASGSLIRLTPHRSPPRGLDPSLLQVFPTFPYSSVKDLHKDQKHGLECAICLLEFEDDNMLRLLTLCSHIFHRDCIDLWLGSHKTCPVCRRDLNSPPEEPHKDGHGHVSVNVNVNDSAVVVTSIAREIRINVPDDERNEDGGSNGNQIEQHEHQHQHEQNHDQAVTHQHEQMFLRSHSTGHSIVLIRGEGDEEKDIEKYTLRLPEHDLRVRHNKHHCTRSCASDIDKDMAGIINAPSAPCRNCGFVQPVPINTSSSDHTRNSSAICVA